MGENMDAKLDKKLCALAPHLFADRYAPMAQTALCWGFECGDGWYGIIEKAAKKLERLIVAEIEKYRTAYDLGAYRASQVKEKYGTLCFYLTSGTDEMYALVDKAERQSSKTCEQCGKPGKIRGEYWLYTACNACHKSRERANAR
jgi:hypothetical protein